MIYDTIATKFNVCYFLYSRVFVLFISSKLINIGRKNYENKKLWNIDIPRDENFTLGKRPPLESAC